MLFNFEGSVKRDFKRKMDGESGFWFRRGCSSAGRAPALQAGGQRFDSAHLHQGLGVKKHRREPLAKRHGLIAQPVRAHA